MKGLKFLTFFPAVFLLHIALLPAQEVNLPLGINHPGDDSEPDGLTNVWEAYYYTLPDNDDCDHDGKDDGEDGWAWQHDITALRLPEISYTFIPFRDLTDYTIVAVNSSGDAVLQKNHFPADVKIWSGGQFYDLDGFRSYLKI